jgi:RsiW-degrading membrane proteinase PrsW (M82 family)
MVLFIFFALMYGAVQLFILSSLSRTTSWRSILFGFVAGMSANASVALVIERGSALLFAALLHRPLFPTMMMDSYTLDPFVEEFCKVLPLLVVLLIPRVRIRLGFLDIVVICAALGSGFGFTESTLRLGYSAGAAQWSAGKWLVSQGFGSTCIPGIGVILRSWLPAGGTPVGLFARPNVGLNTHLVWSAIVGLAIGIALRVPGKWKWTALLLFIFAGLDHATSNAAQLHVRFPFMLVPAFAAVRRFAAFYVLVPLVVGIWLDHSAFKRSLADEPELSLPSERQGKLGLITLALGQWRKPAWLRDLWSYVLQRRAFAWSKAIDPSHESLPIDRARLAAMDAVLERNGSMSSSAVPTGPSKAPNRSVYQTILPRGLLRVLLVVFALPPALYFVIGDFPFTARLQKEFANAIVFHSLIGLLIACIIWQVVVLIREASAFSYKRDHEGTQALILYGLSLTTTVGALVFSIVSLLVLPHHKPIQQIGQDWNILSAFNSSETLTAVVLALLLAQLSADLGSVKSPPSEAAAGAVIGAAVDIPQSS